VADLLEQAGRQLDLADPADCFDLGCFDADRDGSGESELQRLVASLPNDDCRKVGLKDLDLALRPFRAGRNDDPEGGVVRIALNLFLLGL
jgi:hypothetical protein